MPEAERLSLRARLVVALVCLAIVSVLPVASAECTVVSPDVSPDINYVTVCTLAEGSYGDGTQEFTYDYLAHVSQATEVDPAFVYSYVRSDQGTWTYDDGEVRHERLYTHLGSGAFLGVRGLAGGGYHANLHQRDQTAVEDGEGACSGIVGPSSCLGAGAWFTVQDVGGVGVGVYHTQRGIAEDCRESDQVGVTAGIVYVPVDSGERACAAEFPELYYLVPFDDLMP